MTARHIIRTAMFLAPLAAAGPVAAQESGSPQPHSAAPAVVLTPQPLSTYIPPPAAVVPATIEQPTVARADTPIPAPAGPAPIASSEGVTPVVHRRREGVVTPVLPAWPGTPASVQGWRWYGWGAATPVGGPGMNPHPQGPGTNIGTAGPAPTEKSKAEPPKADPPKTETPKPAPMVTVPQLPGVDPKPEGNWLPAPAAAISPATSDQPLPVAAPPAVDMGPSAPKPAPAPPIVPTASDPWSSVPPSGAKAPGTSAARASSHR
ncbi:MAG: hypothetical protein K1X57_13210 [Gemmataceae bacterium]|nr:hypothetical protein [Gemmataceae bacterium]